MCSESAKHSCRALGVQSPHHMLAHRSSKGRLHYRGQKLQTVDRKSPAVALILSKREHTSKSQLILTTVIERVNLTQHPFYTSPAKALTLTSETHPLPAN